MKQVIFLFFFLPHLLPSNAAPDKFQMFHCFKSGFFFHYFDSKFFFVLDLMGSYFQSSVDFHAQAGLNFGQAPFLPIPLTEVSNS